MSYVLQILHHPEEGGENVIEIVFEKRYQAEAEERRHRSRPHRAECQTFIIQEAQAA